MFATIADPASAPRERAPTFTPRRDPPAPGNLLIRYITAHAKAFVERRPPEQVTKDWWPEDQAVTALVRAASTPAQLGQVGWAQELARRVVNDTLTVLFPASASAALFQMSPSLAWGNEAMISVPGFAAGTTGNTSAFVAERQPIPVYQPAVTGATLLPYKLAGIMVATREVIESSNAEALITDLVRQSFGRALDEVLLDANPAAPNRPAGLRHAVAAIPASAAADPWGAFVADVSNLADAVAPVAGNAPIVFIGSAGRAIRTFVLGGLDDLSNVEVLGSNAVINDFLCVATAALVSVLGVPEVEVNKVATLTLDDAPAPDPTTPVGPERSLWQTDAYGIKCRLPISWAIRDPRGFAWTTPTGW
jgi:hypothetical protein